MHNKIYELDLPMSYKLENLEKALQTMHGLGGDKTKCRFCGVALQETTTGARVVEDGYACSDCYFELLTESVETVPVSSKGIRKRYPSTASKANG